MINYIDRNKLNEHVDKVQETQSSLVKKRNQGEEEGELLGGV